MTVRLSGARFYAFHGVLEQEALVGGEFEVNVSVRVAPTPAMEGDELEGTISYADLYAEVRESMAQRRQLLEAVALDIAHRILGRWPHVEGGEVEVKKIAPPIAGFTGCASVLYEF